MSPPPRPPPVGFAHRGARLECRDNSLAGFSRALELGARALETDAWLTADGVAVLDHDGFAGWGPWRRPLRTVAAADRPGHMPRIEELYQLGDPPIDLSVDVKDPDAAAPLIAAARHAGATTHLWLCSPDAAALTRWRSLDPDVQLVHSSTLADIAGTAHPYRHLSTVELTGVVTAHAGRLQGAGIGTVNLHHQSWSPAVVDAVHRSGLAAFGWDVQRRRDLDRALTLDLDGVYSDQVALMVAVLSEVAG